MLTAGGMKVRRDPRIHLVNTDLEIRSIGVHDGGECWDVVRNICHICSSPGLYRCEVEVDANQPLAVVHTVEILGQSVGGTGHWALGTGEGLLCIYYVSHSRH